MSKPPPLIVTGLSGLVGSRLAALSSGRFEVARLRGIDTLDPVKIKAVIQASPGVRAVIHLTAFTDVSAAYQQTGDKEGLCYRLNVTGTKNLAEACDAAGLYLILASTDFVFDGRRSTAYTEEDRTNPIEWYGRTKLEAEEAARRSCSWTILRLAFPYAAGPAPKADLIRKIHAKLSAGEMATLFNDQVITPTFVDDVCEAMLLTAERRPAGEVFHVVGSTSLTPCDLGLEIAEAFGLDRELVVASSLETYLKQDPRPRQRSLRLSNAKWRAYAQQHGLAPPVTIQEGLKRVKDEVAV